MIATLSTPTTGYTEFIQQLISESGKSAEFLVLAHNNPTLLARLDDALADRPTVIVDVPQDQWQLDDGDLLGAIQWAAAEGGVEHVVLVGDSSALQRSAGTWRTPTAGHDPVALANAANSSRQAAQDEFQSQLTRLRSVPAIAEAVSQGKLSVTGLFFRAEAGVFAIYNEKTGSFELLV